MKVSLVAVNASYSHTSLACRILKNICAGMDVSRYEYTINDRVEQVCAALYRQRADIYAFSVYIWNVRFITELAQRLKLAAPECVILFGGPEVSYDAEEVLKRCPFVDGVICGEGEQAFYDYVSGKPPAQINGAVFRKVTTGSAEPCEQQSLDALPIAYTKQDLDKLKHRIVYYESSRGCPFRCSYCLSSTSRSVRYVSLPRVFADLKLFMQNHVSLVKFTDRTFNLDRDRTKKILHFILKNNMDTRFHFEIAADLLDELTIHMLKTAPAGMFQLEIGVQSTNQATLTAIDRKTDLTRLLDNVRQLRENRNLHLHLDLIAGLPYENFERFGQSFDEVFALRPDMLQLGFLKLLKGSKIRLEADRYGYTFSPLPPYEVMSNAFLSFDELLRLKGVEDMLEKYYNSACFEKSLAYAMSKSGLRAFAFFLRLSSYWESMELGTRPHSRRELYDILYDFCCLQLAWQADELNLFCDYLKFDFIKNNRGLMPGKWALRPADKAFYRRVHTFLCTEGAKKYLPEHKESTSSYLTKYTKVERFNFDVLGNGNFGENAVIFDYFTGKCMKISENI